MKQLLFISLILSSVCAFSNTKSAFFSRLTPGKYKCIDWNYKNLTLMLETYTQGYSYIELSSYTINDPSLNCNGICEHLEEYLPAPYSARIVSSTGQQEIFEAYKISYGHELIEGNTVQQYNSLEIVISNAQQENGKLYGIIKYSTNRINLSRSAVHQPNYTGSLFLDCERI